jgi:hypothetical protein
MSFINIIGYELALPMKNDHYNKYYIDCILNNKLSCIIETPFGIQTKILETSKTSKTCFYYSKLSKSEKDDEYDLRIDDKIKNIIDINNYFAIKSGLRLCNSCNLLDENFRLKKDYQFNTGIIFASSFPTINHLIDFNNTKKKILSQLLTANSQLASIIGANGYNSIISTTCTSTSSAMCVANSLLMNNECDRIIILTGDNVTNDDTIHFYTSGFLDVNALSSEKTLTIPFKSKHGFILGSGAGAILLEKSTIPSKVSLFKSKTYHVGKMNLSLDTEFNIKMIEHFFKDLSLSSENLIYCAHDTGTYSCTTNELTILNHLFKNSMKELTMFSVKHKIGHSMGHNPEHYFLIHILQNNYNSEFNSTNNTIFFNGLLNPLDSISVQNRLKNIQYGLNISFGLSGSIVCNLYKVNY